ncbi:MAG: hypothetical protein K940chlam7_01779 [Chlamydiae bacterium]|nr:hypothetical protein [Chlamydiota bacterium]
MTGHTKDEKFILSAFEAAEQSGDTFAVLDRYEIGNSIGLSPKTVNTICQLLAKANFIKPVGKTEIRLTNNGTDLVNRLSS